VNEHLFAVPPPSPFVVGVPRSGTTLLRLLLDAHSELSIPPETGWLAAATQLPRQGEAARAALFDLVTGWPQWGDLGLPSDAVRAALRRLEPFALDEGVRAIFRLYAERHAKPRWGDKTPGYALHLEAIRRLLPESRFVHLIRDGRDVAVSVRGLWFSGERGVAEIARDWRDRILAARTQAQRAEGYLELRYEDLVTEPGRELASVCRFVDLSYEPMMLEAWRGAPTRLAEHGPGYDRSGGIVVEREVRLRQQASVTRPIDASLVGGWRGALSAAELADFRAAAGDLLEELGYPDS
jgi:hypothetical protein